MIVRHTNGLIGFQIADDYPLALSIERRDLEAVAAAQNAQYPQYEGHWAGAEWQLATITRRVKSRLGVAFERGERVLARRRDPQEAEQTGCSLPTAYSSRNRIDTAVAASAIRFDDGMPALRPDNAVADGRGGWVVSSEHGPCSP